jgi:hypothetical protein
MSFWQFAQAHWAEIWGSTASLLYIFSEYLGSNPNTQSNSVFQLVQGVLKKQSGK